MSDSLDKRTSGPETILGVSWIRLRPVRWNADTWSAEPDIGTGLYAPAHLAESMNEARDKLLLRRPQSKDPRLLSRAATWPPASFAEAEARYEASERAMGPFGLPEAIASDTVPHSVPGTQGSLSTARSKRLPPPPPPASPLPDGMPIEIMTSDVFDAWQRIDVAAASKSGRYESDARKALTKAVADREQTRVVALRRDWRKRLGELRRDMPNFSQAIEHVELCCQVSEVAATPPRISPMLLVGGPGTGKSRFAMALADLIGSTHFVYNLDTSSTTSVLDGTDKHWSSSEPGQLFRLVALGDVANPVVVLDEIDKAPTGERYRPTAALHSALEPATARQFRDKSCDLVFDASYVVYVATANALSPLSPSLLSRFRLFHIQPPSTREALAVARSVARAQLAEMGLAHSFEPITHGPVLREIALMRGGARAQAAAVRRAVARALTIGNRSISLPELAETAPTGDRSWTH